MDLDEKIDKNLMDEFLISDLVKIIHKSYKHYLMHQLAYLDVTPGQIPFILELIHEPLYQSDLTSKLLLSRAVTAKTLKKLDEKDIIERRVAKDNKRKNEVFLTNKGKDIASKIEEIEENWDNILLKNFIKEFPDLDEEGLKKVLKSLAKASLNSIIEERENFDDFRDFDTFNKMYHSRGHPFKGHHFRGNMSRKDFFRKRGEFRGKKFKK
nr:MarR family winged helix-turn-helix transcriptional regulator [Methanobrevibacter arboriphilus]